MWPLEWRWRLLIFVSVLLSFSYFSPLPFLPLRSSPPFSSSSLFTNSFIQLRVPPFTSDAGTRVRCPRFSCQTAAETGRTTLILFENCAREINCEGRFVSGNDRWLAVTQPSAFGRIGILVWIETRRLTSVRRAVPRCCVRVTSKVQGTMRRKHRNKQRNYRSLLNNTLIKSLLFTTFSDRDNALLFLCVGRFIISHNRFRIS